MIKQCPAHCLLQLLPTYNLLWQEKCLHLMSGAHWVYTSFCILVAIVSIVSNTVITSGLSPVLPPVKDVKSDSFFPFSSFLSSSRQVWFSSIHQHLCCTSELLRRASHGSVRLALSLHPIQYTTPPPSVSPRPFLSLLYGAGVQKWHSLSERIRSLAGVANGRSPPHVY